MFDAINYKNKQTYILVDLSNLFYRISYAHIDHLQRYGFQRWGFVMEKCIMDLLLFKRKINNSTPIICADLTNKNKMYWRHLISPYYKKNRAKAKEKSKIPQAILLKNLDKLSEIFKTIIPWGYVQILGYEADDIIALLSRHFSSQDKVVVIYGRDKDMIQCLDNENTYLYEPTLKSFIDKNYEEVQEYKFKHIIKGDGGDGIPNIFSDLDTFVTPNKRQKVCGDIKLNEMYYTFKAEGMDAMKLKYITDESSQKRYEQNKSLIDFDMIPKKISDIFFSKWDQISKEPTKYDKEKMFTYFLNNDMDGLINNITLF